MNLTRSAWCKLCSLLGRRQLDVGGAPISHADTAFTGKCDSLPKQLCIMALIVTPWGLCVLIGVLFFCRCAAYPTSIGSWKGEEIGFVKRDVWFAAIIWDRLASLLGGWWAPPTRRFCHYIRPFTPSSVRISPPILY